MLDKTELEDLLVVYLGKSYFTPHDRHLFCLAQDELAWTRSWEDWDRRKKVEKLLRGLGDGHI